MAWSPIRRGELELFDLGITSQHADQTPKVFGSVENHQPLLQHGVDKPVWVQRGALIHGQSRKSRDWIHRVQDPANEAMQQQFNQGNITREGKLST